MKKIYLDYAAATPVRKEVVKAMQPFFSERFGNPSSTHGMGVETKEAVERARAMIKSLLHATKSDTIIFTGSGTESINLAIKGIVQEGDHIVTTKMEHKAVLETCRYLEKKGQCTVTYLAVDKYGMVNPQDVKEALTPKTKLITIQYVNNEIGTVQPIKEISKIARKHNLLFHVDACQAGFLDIHVQKLGVDLLTLNGSKIYGPKGIGMLYVRDGVKIWPIIHGGGQEFGVRGGTENVPGIVGFAKALELVQKENEKENKRLTLLQKKLIFEIRRNIPETKINGHPTKHAPHITNVTFQGIDGESLMKHLSEYEIYVSTGSACTMYDVDVSHVLTAIGLSKKEARGSIRFSLGRETTQKDIDVVVRKVKEIVVVLRTL